MTITTYACVSGNDHFLRKHGWVTSSKFYHHVRPRKMKKNFFDLYKFTIINHNLSFKKRIS
jgi:hypothetical protein